MPTYTCTYTPLGFFGPLGPPGFFGPLEALDFEFVETAPKFFSLLSLFCEVKENLLGVLIPAFAARQKVEKIVHAEKLLAVRRLHAT